MGKRGNREGSIYRRKDGRYAAAFMQPGGKRRYFYGRTRAEAADKLQAAQQQAAGGLAVPSLRLTLGAYLDHWLADSVEPSVRPATFVSYEMLARRHIKPELGRARLANLSAADIQAFLNKKRKEGLSTRTVQYLHAVLRRALGQAERWGLVTRNVAKLVSPPRVQQKEIHPLTPLESRQLLEAVRGDRLEALYTVALAVGLRQAEALGLKWEDVNFEAGTLSVRGSLQRVNGRYQIGELKTRRSRRTIKLPRLCVDVLDAHKGRQDDEKLHLGDAWVDWGLVFSRGDGTPLSRSSVTHRFQRILAETGIARRRFHDLRHTCATLLLSQGIPLRVVMETLGHSNMSTTADIYAHVLPVLMAEAAERMDKILAAESLSPT